MKRGIWRKPLGPLRLIILLSILFMGISMRTQAQLAVIDNVQVAQQLDHHVETIERWIMQLHHLERQYKAITGKGILGTALNSPDFHHYLPTAWMQTYTHLQEKGYEALEGLAKEIYRSHHLFESCDFLLTADKRLACEAQAVKTAQDKAFAIQAYNTAKKRLAQIESLMHAINQTDNLKSIADLQGRIAAEQANIQNEHTKLKMYELASDAEKRLQTQSMHAIHMRNIAKSGGLDVQPMTFKGWR